MANFNFLQSAQKALSNSFLQTGREKKQWRDIEGEEVTLIGVDRNSGPAVDDKGNVVVNPDTGEVVLTQYTTVILAEYPDNYFGGFSDLDRIVENYLSSFDTAEECTEALKEFGGVKIVARTQRKNGKNIRKIQIIG